MRAAPILSLAAVALFLWSPAWGTDVFLKNGDQIECQSYRQEGNTFYVTISEGTEIDLAVDEVDLERTPVIIAGTQENSTVQEGDAKEASTAGDLGEIDEAVTKDKTFWSSADTPENFLPGDVRLKEELVQLFERYNKAVLAGNFESVLQYMPAYQVRMTREALAKVTDKNELSQRKKTMRELAVKGFRVRKCAVSPDGKTAALAGTGKTLHRDKYRDSKGTVKFVKEKGAWKISFQIWS